jgi:recombination protein RecT
MISNLKNFNAVIKLPQTQDYLDSVLGERKSTFISTLTALVSNDKKLQECTPVTLMYAALTATALNLPIDKNLGFSYVIPYKDNRRGISEAQFQLGAKGFIQLAMNSGQFSRINVTDVREGELVGIDRLSGDTTFKWDNSPERSEKPVIGYVAFFRLLNGFEKSLYMTKEEIEQHALRYSQTYASKNDYVRKNSTWTTNFNAMAQKTVLKRLLSKYAPLSIDMQTAIKADQSIQREAGNYHYADNDKHQAMAGLSELAAENAEAEDVESEEVTDNNEEQNTTNDEKTKQ